MLVYELGMPVPAQQHTEIVKPGHNTLKLYAIDQKNREVGFVLTNMIQERVLQVLHLLGHG